MEYGNLAYKIEPEIEAKEKKSVAKAPKRKLNIRAVIFAVAISMSAYFMISKQVAVYETEKEISKLTATLEEMKSVETQKNFELEQSVDLNEVEEIAVSKLNMQRPEHGQKVYINITSEDSCEVTAGQTESIGNRVSGFASNVKKNIIGIIGIG